MASTKVCAVCKAALSRENFGPDKAKRDGLRSYCYECDRRLARERALRAKDKVKVFVAEKVCLDCNTLKPRTEFYSKSSHSDGLTSYCKECTEKRNREARKHLRPKEPTVERKVCPGCDEEKPAADFYLSPKRGDGLSWVCKVCTRKQAAGWAASNPERKKTNDRRKAEQWRKDGRGALQSKKYREKYPEKMRAFQRDWSARNREHVNEYARLYHRAHPEVSRRAVQKWTKNNPIKNRLKEHRRKSRMLELPFELESTDVNDIYEMFGDECGFCGDAETKLTLEHVVPLKRSDVPNPGTVRGNLMPLCKPCNSSKGTKLLEEYLLNGKMPRPEIVKRLEVQGMTPGEMVAEIQFLLHMLEGRDVVSSA
jgi:5-methylcytosine-specific restriction endonuclease McrA